MHMDHVSAQNIFLCNFYSLQRIIEKAFSTHIFLYLNLLSFGNDFNSKYLSISIIQISSMFQLIIHIHKL